MRSRRSKYFLRFCSLFSILSSFFRHFFSLAFSRDINPRDIVRHQPRANISTHLPLNGLLYFLSTQETSWDINRGRTSYCIFLRYQPKRRRETSTGGRYLYTSTLKWALADPPKRCSKTSTEGGHLDTSTLEWALVVFSDIFFLEPSFEYF